MSATISEAGAKYRPDEMRRRLKITPDKMDPSSALLWGQIYLANSRDDLAERIEKHIEELQRALQIVRGV